MAVARIKLTERQHEVLAGALPPDLKRAAREVKRAALRPGKTAELTGDEVRAMLPHAVGDAAEALAVAVAQVDVAERREREGAARMRATVKALHQNPTTTRSTT